MSDETLQIALLQWLHMKNNKLYQTGARDAFEIWHEAFGNMETVLKIQMNPVITMRHLVYNVKHSGVSINSSLLTIT
jgi:hypothetical protein